MDIRPWIALVVVLGLAALLLAGLAVSLVRPSRRTTTPAEDAAQDDLPGFLESPPGMSTATPSAGGRFVTLAAPPAPPPPVPERSPSGRGHALIAAAAALLVAVAAVLIAVWAPGGGADRRPRDSAAPRDVQARLTFAGVVLEQRAVGVTVTYPEVEVTGDAARLTLPTWNCLTVEAPDEPAEAGCVPGRTEYAELAAPTLSMSRRDGTLRFSGDFATSTRPTGSPPEATGRVYPIAVDVTPEAGARSGRWRPARAVLHLADRETVSVEGEMRVRD